MKLRALSHHRFACGLRIYVFNRNAPLDVQAAYVGYNYNNNDAGTGATGMQFNLGVRYTFQ